MFDSVDSVDLLQAAPDKATATVCSPDITQGEVEMSQNCHQFGQAMLTTQLGREAFIKLPQVASDVFTFNVRSRPIWSILKLLFSSFLLPSPGPGVCFAPPVLWLAPIFALAQTARTKETDHSLNLDVPSQAALPTAVETTDSRNETGSSISETT